MSRPVSLGVFLGTLLLLVPALTFAQSTGSPDAGTTSGWACPQEGLPCENITEAQAIAQKYFVWNSDEGACQHACQGYCCIPSTGSQGSCTYGFFPEECTSSQNGTYFTSTNQTSCDAQATSNNCGQELGYCCDNDYNYGYPDDTAQWTRSECTQDHSAQQISLDGFRPTSDPKNTDYDTACAPVTGFCCDSPFGPQDSDQFSKAECEDSSDQGGYEGTFVPKGDFQNVDEACAEPKVTCWWFSESGKEGCEENVQLDQCVGKGSFVFGAGYCPQ